MNRKGFSLLEVIVYTAIIGVVGTLMTGILVSLLKIQNKQVATTEVHQQTNFVILNIQRLVRESRSINMTAGVQGGTLTLVMTDSTKNPTLIYKSGTRVYMKEGTSPEVPLTSNDVTIEDLQFTKLSAATGYDSVQFTISMSYTTDNPQRAFSKTITSTVAHFNPQS